MGDYTHVRLNIFLTVVWPAFEFMVTRNAKVTLQDKIIDLAGLVNGGKVVGCNDMFFGDMHNLINLILG